MGLVQYFRKSKILVKKCTFQEKRKYVIENRDLRDRETEDWRHYPLSELLEISEIKSESTYLCSVNRVLYTIYE